MAKTTPLAIPELEAVEVHGMSRGAFLARGALATGALLGALVMQSLVSGMVLMGIEAPLQDIVVGIVLVLAVALDTIVRRRAAR